MLGTDAHGVFWTPTPGSVTFADLPIGGRFLWTYRNAPADPMTKVDARRYTTIHNFHRWNAGARTEVMPVA